MGVVLALLVLIVLGAAALVKGPQGKGGWKILSLLGASFLPALGYLVCLLIIGLGGRYPQAERALCTGGFALAELAIVLRIFRLWGSRKARRVFFAAAGALAAAVIGFFGWAGWDESILRVDDSDFVLEAYVPYGENSRCAELDGEADFTLSSPLKLDGATALYPVYAAFAKATFPEGVLDGSSPYAIDNEVRCTTTAHAYRSLVDGERDMIFVAGASDRQAEYAASKGEELVFTPIGQDAFVFFVNARNPVKGLTVQQLRGIYSGEITNWQALGGNPGRIRAFQREEGSGSQTQLERFMGDVELMQAEKQDVVDGMGGIISRTASYRNYKSAVGYSFRFYATEMVPSGEIRLLAVNGVEPTAEHIADGSYPLGGAFYAVHLASNENPEIDAFLDWILSGQGQELVEKTGYVRMGP